MRILFVITVLHFFPACIKAQEIKHFDTTILGNDFDYLFKSNPGLKEMLFTSSREKERYVEFNYLTRDKLEHYSLDYEGDRYVLGERFGTVPSVDNFIKLLATKTCRYFWSTEIRVVPDTVFCRLSYICEIDRDIDYAESIDNRSRYSKGLRSLENDVSEALTDLRIKDSAMFFKFLVLRDSTIQSFQSLSGDNDVTRMIRHVINTSGPWVPLILGGRSVKAYMRMFVRVDADGRVRVYVEGME